MSEVAEKVVGMQPPPEVEVLLAAVLQLRGKRKPDAHPGRRKTDLQSTHTTTTPAKAAMEAAAVEPITAAMKFLMKWTSGADGSRDGVTAMAAAREQ
jgi:hypothetical protein